MGFLIWIVVGLIAGWLAGQVMKTAAFRLMFASGLYLPRGSAAAL